MHKKIILAAIAASTIHTSVIAGFFDNLVDNLKNGDLNSLVSDVVTDVASEIDEAQDNSDIKSDTKPSGFGPAYQKVGTSLNSGSKTVAKSLDNVKDAIDSLEKYVLLQEEKYPKLTGFYQYGAYSKSNRKDHLNKSRYPLRYEHNEKSIGHVDMFFTGRSADTHGKENILKMVDDSCEETKSFNFSKYPFEVRYSKYREDRKAYEEKASAGDLDSKIIVASLDLIDNLGKRGADTKKIESAIATITEVRRSGDQAAVDATYYMLSKNMSKLKHFFVATENINAAIEKLKNADRSSEIKFSTGTIEDLRLSEEFLIKKIQVLACKKNTDPSRSLLPFVYLMKNTPESVELATRARIEKIYYCDSVLSDDDCNFYKSKILKREFAPFFKNAQENLKLDDVTLGFIKLEGLDGTVDIEAAIGHFGEYLSEHFPSEEIRENVGHLILTPENQEVVYIYDIAMGALEQLTMFAIQKGDESLINWLFTLRTKHLFYKQPTHAKRLSHYATVEGAERYKKGSITYPSDRIIKIGKKNTWIKYKQKEAKKSEKPSNNARGKIVL
jgi:hypothetical protein